MIDPLVLSANKEPAISPDMKRRTLFREVNDEIRTVTAGFRIPGESYDLFCECGRPECVARLGVPATVYDLVRRTERTFVVLPGHELGMSERVVAREARYRVVTAA